MAYKKIIPQSKAELIAILDSSIKTLRGNQSTRVLLDWVKSLKDQAEALSDDHDMTPLAYLFETLYEWGPISYIASMDTVGMHSITTIGQFAGAEIHRIAPAAVCRRDIGAIWFVTTKDLAKIIAAANNWTPVKFVPDLKSNLIIDGEPA